MNVTVNGCEIRSGARSAGLALCVAVWLLNSATATAEIFECKGADGKTVYTSDRSACPDSKPHELKADLQTVVPSPGASAAAAARAARPTRDAASAGGDMRRSEGQVPDGMIEMWRRKRPDAEAKLALLEQRAEYIRSVVGGCNRGATWYAKDDAGLKHYVSCEEIRGQREAVEKEIAELKAYLAGGLEEECRRAGCLPGWIR